jgi:D-beta-D-heptose 7-phosphate kinase/D-beta-D-heptose 1-phosphate adenosyltransferase
MKIVFTNGCFDIIHVGHVKLLEFARSLGDRLIVGLNSDSSVGRLKGSTRPVNKQQDRKIILESLKSVDEVLIFEEDTPLNLIKSIKPDLIVKGGDYTPENVIGKDFCDVVIFKYINGYSTTQTIKNISNR